MEEKQLILVIDDEPLLRAATVRVLEKAGYRTSQAADGLAGLQMARDQKPDLTLLDVNLPDISGIEVCHLIKSDPALLGCFVILLSGERIDAQSQAEGLEGGADGYIARPISNVELLARVQAMLRIQQSEAALRESEAKLKKAQQYAHMGSWTWNIKANHLDWSDEMFHIFGLEKDTFTGSLETVIANAIHPEDRKKVDESNFSVSQEKKPVPLEYRVIWPDNSVHTVWAEAGELKLDEAGNPEFISGYVLDITERKQAEETLRENEKKLRMIFETMSEGIALNEIIYNESGEMIDYRILDVNNAFYETADYSGKLVVGNVASVLYGMPLEIIKAFWETHRTDKEVQHTEMLSPLNNKWFYISTSPFIDNKFITSFFDITERKQAEEELRQSQELFSSAFHASPAGITITRIADGKIIDANQAFLDMFGFSREETIGHTSLELKMLDPDERGKLIQQQLASGGLQNFELLSRTKSGRLVNLLFSSKPLDLGGEACHITTMIDITERKLAEDALSTLTERLTLATRSAQIGIWDWNIQNNILVWDNQMFKLYGIDQEQFPGAYDAWLNGIHPDDRDRSNEVSQKAINGQGEYDTEFRVVWPDGSVHWLKADGQVFRDEHEQAIRMAGVNYDITERKQAEEVSRISEQKYRNIFDNAPLGVFQTTPVGKFISANSALANMLGYSSAQEMIRLITNIAEQHYAEPPTRTKAIIAALSAGKFVTTEDKFRRINGTTWIGRSLARTVFDELGKPIYYEGFIEDITDRKQAEEELVQSHDLLTNIARLVPGVVYQYRLYPDGRSAFPYSSPGMNDIYEVTPEEVREDATPVFGRLHPDDYNRVADSIQESARTLETFYCEFRVILPRQGLRWRWSQAQPERTDDGGTLWYGIISDITERKQAEQELEQAHAQLRRVNARLAETEEAERRALAKELHDRVGQSLTALNINLGLIRSRVEKESPQELSRRFDSASDLVTEITDHIRNVMAELHPPVLDDYGLAAALRWYAGRLQQQIGLKVEVIGELIEPRLPQVTSMALFRIAQEALTNIVKHAHASLVTIELMGTREKTEMAIIDNGVGFDSSHPAAEGVAHWGLATMRERAEAINGYLAIESAPGKGTIIKIIVARCVYENNDLIGG